MILWLLLLVAPVVLTEPECLTDTRETCHCIFPFIYEGRSYDECTDQDSRDAKWCATAVDDYGVYTDYGWCFEDDTEKTTTEEEDVCAGHCDNPNQECRVQSGQAVCKCLQGYWDMNEDGNSCKCVREWTDGDPGFRDDICSTCPRGYELKTWQHKTNGKQKKWCQKEARGCNPDRHELNEKYPNVKRIGQGYNIVIGNLLKLPDSDVKGHYGKRGLQQRIFNPYSVNVDDSSDRCQVHGYIFDQSKHCRASLKTTVFSNSKQVVKKIEEKVSTGSTVEEFTFSVSEGDNAQFSNSVSFGSSFSQSSDSTTGSSSNHCVDESVSESTETGSTVEQSSTSEKSKSFEQSKSESKNSESSTSDTQTRSTSSDQSSSATVGTSATVSGGWSGFGASVSASATVSAEGTFGSTSSQSSEDSKTNSFTQGSTSESGYSRSDSSSDSNTNTDSFTNTASNQKSITTNICSEGSQSSTNTNGEEVRKDQNNEYNKGSTFEKSFEIPGDSRSVIHSTAVAESEEFFQETSGSISHTEASCTKYSARLNNRRPPAFTKDFKDMIREMDSLTEELWDTNIETKKLDDGTLISRKNEQNEKRFDDLFTVFIEQFGTHYIQKASMGGIQRISSKIESLKEDEADVEQVESCLNKAIKEKKKDKSFLDGNSVDNCDNEHIENRVKSAIETSVEQVETVGAPANKDIYAWTDNDFNSPTLLPDFNLQPIVKLFQPNFMNNQRITREDGTAINHQRILSWLMPRYVILVGRCKLMKNYHVSEGKTCVPNKEYLVSTRDGNDVTDLATLCRSLPDHVLEPGATDCHWCPEGVDHSKRICNNGKMFVSPLMDCIQLSSCPVGTSTFDGVHTRCISLLDHCLSQGRLLDGLWCGRKCGPSEFPDIYGEGCLKGGADHHYNRRNQGRFCQEYQHPEADGANPGISRTSPDLVIILLQVCLTVILGLI